ncbi:MAG: hypothetical protein IT279_07700 [Ignavibacteriaceae bacterium]|nr:hypothetical protein [Ignavibacteriaceae bacterium]
MKVLSFVLIAGFFTVLAFGQTDSKGRYGLEFSGNHISFSEEEKYNKYNIPHLERSRLTIPDEGLLAPGNNFTISFDFYIWHPKRYGQILTINSPDEKAVLELVYSSVTDSDTSYISVVKFRTREIFRIPLLKSELGFLQWKKLTLKYDKGKKEIVVHAGSFSGKAQATIDYPEDIYLTFGRGVDHETPSMGLRDIRIFTGGQLQHYYPLDEVSGTLVHDNESDLHGRQEFGEWIAPKHFGWETHSMTQIKDEFHAVVLIDTLRGEITFFGESYYIKFTPDLQKLEEGVYANERYYRLNEPFIDHERSKVYAMFGSPVEVSVYDIKKKTWTPVRESYEEEWKYFGAGIFHDQEEDKLYRFGGYGWYRTNKEFYIYDFKKKIWEELEYDGDPIAPRTVLYLGKGPGPGTFWMAYGTGNEDGDQRKGWLHYYDLYLMDVRNKKLKKYWSLSEKGIGQVQAMSRTLMWSEDFKKIYIFSGNNDAPYVHDIYVAAIGEGMSVPEKVGDYLKSYRLPDKVRNLALMQSRNKKVLYAVLQYDREPGDAIQFLRLYLPHYSKEEFESVKNKYAVNAGGNWFLLFAPVALGLLLVGFIWKFRSRFVVVPEYPDEDDAGGESRTLYEARFDGAEARIYEPVVMQNNRNAAGIYLIGDFRVIDENGVDISGEIKGKIRELFLQMILFKYMKGKPLSYQFAHETLWSDFDEARRSNNRKVTISALRKSLESFPEIEVETNDHTLLVATGNLYCDLGEGIYVFKKLKTAEEPKSALDERAIQLLGKGLLLKNSSCEWLDPFAEQYSSLALDALDILSKRCDGSSPDRLLKLGLLYFEFDQFSETGLQLKIKGYIRGKKPHLAVKEYNAFCAKYEKYFAEGFGVSFEELATDSE